MLTPILVMLAVALSQLQGATKPCSERAVGRSTRLYLEAAGAPDTAGVAAFRLCLAAPTAGVGSYSATLSFDSTAARVTRVDVSGGMQVANANVGGKVRLAGAAPAGFRSGALATVRLKLLRGRSLPRIRLALNEASSPAGVSVIASAKVSGYPPSDSKLGVVETGRGASAGDGSAKS